MSAEPALRTDADLLQCLITGLSSPFRHKFGSAVDAPFHRLLVLQLRELRADDTNDDANEGPGLGLDLALGRDGKAVCEALDGLLHDRRVVYYHAWEKGDLLVSDNILAMHTRSDFTAGCDRELWRIHFD